MNLIKVVILVTILTTLGGAFISMLIHRPKHKTKDELYKEHFKPHRSDYTRFFSRGHAKLADEDSLGKIKYQGFDLYEKEEYAQSIQYFEAYLRGEPSNLLVPFYLGVAYMVIDSMDKAELQFEEVLRNNRAIFYDLSQWYDALIALKKEDYIRARALVSEFTTLKGHDLKDQAKDLVKDLDKLIEEQTFKELNLGLVPHLKT